MSDSDNSEYDSGSESGNESSYGDGGNGQADNFQCLTLGTRDLNLSPRYVSDWIGIHAYREVLQNQ
jgi:hypothetical protein